VIILFFNLHPSYQLFYIQCHTSSTCHNMKKKKKSIKHRQIQTFIIADFLGEIMRFFIYFPSNFTVKIVCKETHQVLSHNIFISACNTIPSCSKMLHNIFHKVQRCPTREIPATLFTRISKNLPLSTYTLDDDNILFLMKKVHQLFQISRTNDGFLISSFTQQFSMVFNFLRQQQCSFPGE
jgi:hypothetical protein